MNNELIKKALEGKEVKIDELSQEDKELVYQLQKLRSEAKRFVSAAEVVGLVRDTLFMGPFISVNQVPVSEGDFVQTDIFTASGKSICSVIGEATRVPGGWGATVYYKGQWMIVPLYPEKFVILIKMDVISMVGELPKLDFAPPQKEDKNGRKDI